MIWSKGEACRGLTRRDWSDGGGGSVLGIDGDEGSVLGGRGSETHFSFEMSDGGGGIVLGIDLNCSALGLPMSKSRDEDGAVVVGFETLGMEKGLGEGTLTVCELGGDVPTMERLEEGSTVTEKCLGTSGVVGGVLEKQGIVAGHFDMLGAVHGGFREYRSLAGGFEWLEACTVVLGGSRLWRAALRDSEACMVVSNSPKPWRAALRAQRAVPRCLSFLGRV